MARLAIFIDGGYLDKLQVAQFGGVRCDIALLAQAMTDHVRSLNQEPIDLLRAYYYHCLPHQGTSPTAEESERYARKRAFFDAVERLPRTTVRRGHLAQRGVDAAGNRIFEQKRVDLMLGLDLALLCGKNQIQHAALLAGDSDFVPALEVGKREGVCTWLFHGPRQSGGASTFHQDLWDQADERFELTMTFMAACERRRQ